MFMQAFKIRIFYFFLTLAASVPSLCEIYKHFADWPLGYVTLVKKVLTSMGFVWLNKTWINKDLLEVRTS